jgi:hypothetical protein
MKHKKLVGLLQKKISTSTLDLDTLVQEWTLLARFVSGDLMHIAKAYAKGKPIYYTDNGVALRMYSFSHGGKMYTSDKLNALDYKAFFDVYRNVNAQDQERIKNDRSWDANVTSVLGGSSLTVGSDPDRSTPSYTLTLCNNSYDYFAVSHGDRKKLLDMVATGDLLGCAVNNLLTLEFCKIRQAVLQGVPIKFRFIAGFRTVSCYRRLTFDSTIESYKVSETLESKLKDKGIKHNALQKLLKPEFKHIAEGILEGKQIRMGPCTYLCTQLSFNCVVTRYNVVSGLGFYIGDEKFPSTPTIFEEPEASLSPADLQLKLKIESTYYRVGMRKT